MGMAASSDPSLRFATRVCHRPMNRLRTRRRVESGSLRALFRQCIDVRRKSRDDINKRFP